MDFGILILTLFQGKFIGKDEFGNRYYQQKKPREGKQARRWVLFKGKAEASKVPAEWHGWLHHTFAEPPQSYDRYSWQRRHLPNLSGTPLAHRPDIDSKLYPRLTKISATAYEPWQP